MTRLISSDNLESSKLKVTTQTCVSEHPRFSMCYRQFLQKILKKNNGTAVPLDGALIVSASLSVSFDKEHYLISALS